MFKTEHFIQKSKESRSKLVFEKYKERLDASEYEILDYKSSIFQIKHSCGEIFENNPQKHITLKNSAELIVFDYLAETNGGFVAEVKVLLVPLNEAHIIEVKSDKFYWNYVEYSFSSEHKNISV